VNRPRPQTARLLAAAACLGLLPGCWRVAGQRPEEQIGFYLSSREDVLYLRRVVFVELTADGDCPSSIARDTTEAIRDAVLSKKLFHLDVVRRSDPMCRDLPLDRIGALKIEELPQIRDSLDCQAVLFGRITHFQAHPRMKMGLHLKLIELRDGKLVWGIDHVWDTADRGLEDRIRRYYHRELRSGYDPLGYDLVLTSPQAFEKFIGYEVANTLTPPEPPAPPAADGGSGDAATAGAADAGKSGQTDRKSLK
jgi:hypothetical protein